MVIFTPLFRSFGAITLLLRISIIVSELNTFNEQMDAKVLIYLTTFEFKFEVSNPKNLSKLSVSL